MTGVDDRIVSMKFDNEAFERKINDTIKSLDKLRQSLDFANSTRGMNELSSAAKGFDMSHVGVNIEGISAKFLAMSTVAISVLSTVASAAINAGAQVVKALSLDPIISGFHEYETNLNSIQTILANTRADGTNLEQVNAALDQLNTYSDQTIYNFSQMARNIGTFTAAGVDLDTSVGAIKGIANLAAISGSNAEQASTAMYQLSQALASGTVKLIDWNSVVNAGMGGEVFQKSLFETGKMMGKIANVDMSTSFEDWTAAGNTFRGSLEDGWLTAEVLTNTLAGFTGDLTEAQILSMGYTQEQATEILALGASGKAAATEVKTLTQLIGTVKEAVGSGWSASFRLILGDFNEAKTLFTNINNGIGAMVSNSAKSRNELLTAWKSFGGRDTLIQGLTDALHGLISIVKPIKQAFRDIFPAMTAERLIQLTMSFANFAKRLTIGAETAEKIGNAFRGFFAILEIGWEIVKNIAGLIGGIIGSLSGVGSGILDFASSAGTTLTDLNAALVAGGGIRDFFDKLTGVIKDPINKILEFKDAIVELFESGDASDAVGSAVGRVSDRLGVLGQMIEHVVDAWNWMEDRLSGIVGFLDQIWDHLATWFSELGSKLAETFSSGDFDEAVDLVNVGLLGGIALLLKKFVTGGLKLDIGDGLFKGIKTALDGLTGTLSAMQANLKSKTLMNIAIAVGILAASVLVLSMIDSEALTRALGAMAVGFAELMGSMALMSSSIFNTSVGKMSGLATVMILLSVSAGILSIAVTNLSQLDWEELAKGLLGVSIALGILVVATKAITADTAGLISAGIAMIAISLGLIVLSKAIKEFAEMSWGEMGQGLAGISGALTALVAATRLMPAEGMMQQGAGLILLATGLLILSKAVEAFAAIPWGDLLHGFVGIGAGLLIIAGAMWLMPPNMILTAAGLLVLSAALLVLAQAVQSMASMDFGDMAKGIGGIAVLLGVLAIAMAAMSGSVVGAIALILVSSALMVLVSVLEKLSQLSIQELALGLGAIAAVLLVLGIAAALMTPVIPVLLGLAAAMFLLGAAFTLFGLGAFLIAKAFEALVKAGQTGLKVLVDVIEIAIEAIPKLLVALATGLMESVTEVIKAAPLLVDAIKVLLSHILDTVIELVPKIVEALGEIVTGWLTFVREKFPEVLATGLSLLLTLLQGIRDNIDQLVTAGVELITAFVGSLIANMPMLVNSALQLLTAFLNEISRGAGLIVGAGVMLLMSLLQGIAQNVINIANTVGDIISAFIVALGANYQKIIDAGFWVLTQLISGIANNIIEIVNVVGTLVATFVTALGDNAYLIATAGGDALIKFLEGVANKIPEVARAGGDVVIAFITALGSESLRVATAAADVLIDFINGLADAIEDKSGELRDAGMNIAGAIIDGMTGGLASKAGDVVGGLRDMAGDGLSAVGSVFGIGSPSKEFYKIGQFLMQGLALGISDDKVAIDSAEELAKNTIESFQDTIKNIPFDLLAMNDVNPVITPVLDLTKVTEGSKNIQKLMEVSPVVPEVSIERARTIATTKELEATPGEPAPYMGPTEVTFEQNIYSPEALSTNDIYRNTKSQIALAKEELNIA